MDRYDELMKTVDDIIEVADQDLSQENANTAGQTPMGMVSISSGETLKRYAEDNLLSEDVLKAYREGYIHIHDFDLYATGTTTCCQIPLGKLLEEGFYVGECFMRPPQSIMTATALASIIMQSNQNMQHR